MYFSFKNYFLLVINILVLFSFTKAKTTKVEKSKNYYKFIESNGIDNYLIELGEHSYKTRVVIELQILNGDADIDFATPNPYTFDKFKILNKIFFTIFLSNVNFNELEFFVIGYTNSYYSLKSNIIDSFLLNSDSNIYSIESGVSHLQLIKKEDNNQTNIIFFSNSLSKENKSNYLISFHSINCDSDIIRMKDKQKLETKFTTFTYAQDLLKYDSKYKKENFEYEIKINNIANKIDEYEDYCIYFISEIELNEKNEKEILLNDGVTQNIIFDDNIKQIKYLYIMVDPFLDTYINLNLVGDSKYNVNIFFEKYKVGADFIVLNSKKIFLSDIFNDYNDLSEPINVEITISLADKGEEKLPMVELTLQSDFF